MFSQIKIIINWHILLIRTQTSPTLTDRDAIKLLLSQTVILPDLSGGLHHPAAVASNPPQSWKFVPCPRLSLVSRISLELTIFNVYSVDVFHVLFTYPEFGCMEMVNGLILYEQVFSICKQCQCQISFQLRLTNKKNFVKRSWRIWKMNHSIEFGRSSWAGANWTTSPGRLSSSTWMTSAGPSSSSSSTASQGEPSPNDTICQEFDQLF